MQAQFQFVAQGLLEIEVANEAELGDKTMLATITLAALSWVFFEKPLNQLKRFFPYRAKSTVGTTGLLEEQVGLSLIVLYYLDLTCADKLIPIWHRRYHRRFFSRLL